MIRKLIISFLAVFTATASISQQSYPQFGLATDLGVQRNFKKEQRYWAIGHTVTANFHLTHKEGVYVMFAYHSNGKFSNRVTATAKLPATLPQTINYTNEANMRIKQFTIGYKKYLKGAADAEKGWNLYGFAGFGLLLGKVNNTHSTVIDTVDYNVPVRSGEANFKRLTFDLGLGWELPLGGDFYFYTEAKAAVPASDYPSKYIFVNKNAPFTGWLGAGLRILF